MLKLLWLIFCTIAGAAIGAALLGFWLDSLPLAVVGAIIGAALGWGFGKLVPAHEVLLGLLP